MSTALDAEQTRAILSFYESAGVTTAEVEAPGGLWSWEDTPRKKPEPRPEAGPRPAAPPRLPGTAPSTDEALAEAERLAAAASTLEELVATIAAFEGCPLREGARGPVVYDGVLGADVLLLGEAPGREEDRQGKPFVGRSGQLLDRMLGSIGLSRAPGDAERPVCISNAIYWRPPGNRNPTPAEVAVCLPFMKRFIALSAPKLVLLSGNVPTKALFPDAAGITRSRGQFRSLDLPGLSPISALPIFHPAFLLRQPAQKRWAWRDLLAAKAKLNETLS